MHKTWMLALTLLVSAAWLQAQEPQSGSSQSGSSQTGAAAASGQTESEATSQSSVEGCLQGSNGSFTLTDNSGTTYQLEGNTSKLSEHVGHEVQVTGSTSGSKTSGDSAMAPGSSTGSSAAGSSPTLTVKKVKHISKTCKSMSK